jgi:hypothetical protein
MSTYSEYANQSRSQKIILAHVDARERVKLFSVHSGSTYVRDTKYFITSVKVDGEYLVKAETNTLNQGEFFFSPIEGKLYIRNIDDSDPIENSNWIGIRFFFANIDCNLPSDITSGEFVHYESRITDIGDLKLELDFENSFIALESNSNISLENNDSFFDPIFDTLVWENNQTKFYSYSKSIAPSEAKLIYVGLISDKTFSSEKIKFTLKDQLNILKQPIEVGRFTALDGDIDDSMIDKPKRLIFGRVDKIRTQGIDKVLKGYNLSGLITGDSDRNLLDGTVSALEATTTINGNGTNFLTLTVGEKIRIIQPLNEYVYEILTINSATSITTTQPITASFNLALIRDLSIENNIIEGVGTDFVNELSPDDKIKVKVNGLDYDYTIAQIISPTQAILSNEIEFGFYSVQSTSAPSVNYRRKNRDWHIAGHKLREYSTTIINVIDAVNIEVDPIGDIQENDVLFINSNPYTVIRVSNQKIRLNQGLIGATTAGDLATKIPVKNVFVGDQKFIINRDFSISNTPTDSVIEFNELAEFNVAPNRFPSIQFEFTSGSNIVNSLSTDVDITNILKPRDWIRAKSINFPTWYEILSVEQTSMVLRSNALVTFSGLAQTRSPEYLGDDALVVADCLGMDNSDWVRFPAHAVKWILEKAGVTNLDNDSFQQASDDCMFDLSLYYPESLGAELPVVRDMITDINQSCFGSLVMSDEFKFKYQILNSDKPDDLAVLSDDDILSFTVATKNSIVNSVLLNYAPYVDTSAGSETFKTILIESDFVNQAIEKKERLTVTSHLYFYDDALTIAERWLFFRSLTQTVVSVKSKMNLMLNSLNDKVHLNLSRLFTRFGGSDRRKIGIINSITKDGEGTTVEFNDLGNIFNRVPSISPDEATDFSDTNEDVVKWGFILDNKSELPTEVPLNENGLGNNLIG